MRKLVLIVAALLALVATAIAADPCDRLGDGSKDFSIAAGGTLKVALGGETACAFLKVDAGLVRWSFWKQHFSTWVHAKPNADIGDSTALVTEDDPGEWIGVLDGARAVILINPGLTTATGRLRWALK